MTSDNSSLQRYFCVSIRRVPKPGETPAPAVDLLVDPGAASIEEIDRVMDVLSDINKAQGGAGLTFTYNLVSPERAASLKEGEITEIQDLSEEDFHLAFGNLDEDEETDPEEPDLSAGP